MFIGHHAVGFALKKYAPRTSLAALMAAPLLLDLVWPLFLLSGLEHVRIEPGNKPFLRLDLYDYPWSHSLVMSGVWSLIFGGGYWLITRYSRGAILIALGVFSHWVFDFITHRPDMPLYPGGPKVGLGIWNSTLLTLLLESVLFLSGLRLYLRSTQAKDRVGKFGLWIFVAFLLFGYFASIRFPPPTDPQAMGWGGLVGWPLLIWVYWFDRHREARIK